MKKFLNSLFQFHKCNPDTKFACESCTFISLSATGLLSHVQSYHVTQRPLSCSLCVFKTTDESQLKSHVITEHEDSAMNQSCFCGAHKVVISVSSPLLKPVLLNIPRMTKKDLNTSKADLKKKVKMIDSKAVKINVAAKQKAPLKAELSIKLK